MVSVDVVGLGFVGLSTAISLTLAGHEVHGYDADPARVALLAEGRLPFSEPTLLAGLTTALGKGLNFPPREAKTPSNGLVIAVPAPTQADGQVHLGAIHSALASHWNQESHEVVAFRSTLTPRAIDDLSDRYGASFDDAAVIWPEFLNQGRALDDALNPDRIVVGVLGEGARTLMQELLAPWRSKGAPIHWVGLREAAAVKHYSNACLAVNKVFASDVALSCREAGLDGAQVLAAVAGDGRLSSELLRPRVGLIDSCLPKDLDALHAASAGQAVEVFLEVTRQRSKAQHDWYVGHIQSHVRGEEATLRVAVLGMGFESAVGDIGRSLALDLVPALRAEAALIIWDPYVALEGLDLAGCSVNASLDATLAAADIAVIVVEHPEVQEVDWGAWLREDPRRLVFDSADSVSVMASADSSRVHQWGRRPECPQCEITG